MIGTTVCPFTANPFVRPALLLLLILLPTAPARAAGRSPAAAVRPQLLADVAGVQPGATFTVGVLLELDPGWHVYWTNPGDSGLPPTVKFDLPDGFTAGELRFPTPTRFDLAGDSVAYGYEGSVLLTASIKAPADLTGQTRVKIAADVNWLVCSDACIPGSAKLDLALPVANGPVPRDERTEKLFHTWAARVPVDAAASVEVANAEWAFDPAKSEATLTVTWKSEVRPPSVALFPAADETLDVRPVSVKTEGNRTTVVVRLHPLAGQKPRAEPLPAVLGYTEKEGQRRGLNTAIPVAGSGKGAEVKKDPG